MSKIFISYRRADSAASCGRIYDRIVARFGKANIFKDVESIPLGSDFKEYIDQVVQQCAVQLVIIGQQWLTITDSRGIRRLDDPIDIVRLEIEAALLRKIPIIPLLVDNAEMPTRENLPIELRPLVAKNGVPVRYDPDFDRDIQRVIATIESLGVPLLEPPPQKYTGINGLCKIVMTAEDDGWVAGWFGTLLRYVRGVWTEASGPGPHHWYGITMLPTGEGSIVGEHIWMGSMGVEGESAIFDYVQGSWSETSSATMRSVIMTSPTMRWAVGDNGWIFQYRNGAWKRFESPTSHDLHAVTMLPTNEGWAVGNKGTILQYIQGIWTQVDSPTSENLYGITMLSEDNGWAVGSKGTILRYRQGNWTQEDRNNPDGNTTLQDVAALSDEVRWIVGSRGTLLQYDTFTLSWRNVQSPTSEDLSSIVLLSSREGWAVGTKGMIIRYRGGLSWKRYT